MKTLLIVMISLVLIGCNQKEKTQNKTDVATKSSIKKGTITGKVIETMDASKYTYVKIKTSEGKEVWVAGPKQEMKVGRSVTVSTHMLMKKFKSKTLDKTFDEVYFVGSFDSNKKMKFHSFHGGKSKKGTSFHGKKNKHSEVITDMKIENIEKAEGGYRVNELFSKKAELKNKTVKVSGVVVKFTPQIMGKNWIHIQDGTGKDGTNDVTVTSQDLVEVGDHVIVTGTFIADKDLGSGYFFPVLLEKSKLEKIKK